MENKQTAVEWLEDVMKNMVYNGADFGDDYPSLLVHIKQAKQIEKEQIEKAFQHSIVAMVVGKVLSPEEYYNETYGK